jgi:FMN phosphatase YigB (HAD superfamily)
VGIAGNQSFRAERQLRAIGLPVDLVVSSETLAVVKPGPAFFLRLATVARVEPGACVYVGDRVDNDLVPAAEAGMRAVFIRRGPWGHIQADQPQAALAVARIESLSELPGVLRSLRTRG